MNLLWWRQWNERSRPSIESRRTFNKAVLGTLVLSGLQFPKTVVKLRDAVGQDELRRLLAASREVIMRDYTVYLRGAIADRPIYTLDMAEIVQGPSILEVDKSDGSIVVTCEPLEFSQCTTAHGCIIARKDIKIQESRFRSGTQFINPGDTLKLTWSFNYEPWELV